MFLYKYDNGLLQLRIFAVYKIFIFFINNCL